MHYAYSDDDLRRLCDDERALLDAMLDAEAAALAACGGMMKPGSTTRAARRMTVKR
ncbi:MAG: hypothetical protein JW388_1544 [Nitrospira sp.]|nr:hypothetical protein [Nitrospira sp.]